MWIVREDFNIRIRSRDKLGGRNVDIDSCNDFESCILRKGLVQMRGIWMKYTWSNNEVGLSRRWTLIIFL